MKYKNTIQKGSIRFIVFKDGGEWYAAGLEFNIVESGSSPQEALILLMDAVGGYLESAKKVKARPGILNQRADQEYESMWRELKESGKTSSRPVFSFGQIGLRSLAAA